MLRLCLKVVLYLFLLLLATAKTQEYSHDSSFSVSDDSKDLPQKSDLNVYLKALWKILEFTSKNKHVLDLNFEFGLFMANVNLKSILTKKEEILPKQLIRSLKRLISANDKLIDFFTYMVKTNVDPKNQGNKMIISLFSNETQWIKKTRVMRAMELKNEGWAFHPPGWNEYVRIVDDMENYVPNPLLSDYCMISLASNPIHELKRSRCDVLEPCYDMLINGTNYGYAFSHRLLFLLMARHARSCSIFSYVEDKDLVQSICSMAFGEAEYIAKHSYGIVDLILEQMSICALDGYAKFLQRRWLTDILRFQIPYGCFGQTRSHPPSNVSSSPRSPKVWKMAKHRDHTIMGGYCNGHVTSVAAGAFAAAVRYIIETYY